jgi:nucleolar protein 58
VVELKAFNKFENTSDALSAATLIIDSKPSKGLRKFLQKHCEGETLAVADSKLGNAIKEKLVSSISLFFLTFCEWPALVTF